MKFCWESMDYLERLPFDHKKGGWNVGTAKCKRLFYLHDTPCIICGDEFIAAKDVKTCSPECGRRYQGLCQAETQRGKTYPNRKEAKESFTCFTCIYCRTVWLGRSSYMSHERQCPSNPNRNYKNGMSGKKGTNQYGKAKREGHILSMPEGTREKLRQINLQRKGGLYSRGRASFDYYVARLHLYEEIRRDPDELEAMQVRCYNHNCKAWYCPTVEQICNRLQSINNHGMGESHFYCSDMCKQDCDIYGRMPIPPKDNEGLEDGTPPEVSSIVRKRANGICERCKERPGVHCHHTEPRKCSPMLEADIDLCLWVCIECHLECHGKDGCTFGYLAYSEFDASSSLP
jgi:hypothetical protein